MAGATITTQDESPLNVVKMPSRRSGQDDRWRIELGEHATGSGTTYPNVSLYLSREEAQDLAEKLVDALN